MKKTKLDLIMEYLEANGWRRADFWDKKEGKEKTTWLHIALNRHTKTEKAYEMQRLIDKGEAKILKCEWKNCNRYEFVASWSDGKHYCLGHIQHKKPLERKPFHRITFSCDKEIKDFLSKQSQGIGKYICQLVERAMNETLS